MIIYYIICVNMLSSNRLSDVQIPSFVLLRPDVDMHSLTHTHTHLCPYTHLGQKSDSPVNGLLFVFTCQERQMVVFVEAKVVDDPLLKKNQEFMKVSNRLCTFREGNK